MAERSEALPPEAIDALQRGNKIEAIKLVREAKRLDLKDAKDKVDDYVKNDPVLQQKFASAQAETTGSLVRWLIIIAVAILGYFFFVAR
jgi:ribosomal protein L7/L12